MVSVSNQPIENWLKKLMKSKLFDRNRIINILFIFLDHSRKLF